MRLQLWSSALSIYSSTDVEYIGSLLIAARDNKEPFAVLTGAGCSISAGIPSSRDLVHQIGKDYPHLLAGLSPEEKADYGRCMGQLSTAEQRRLLKPHLEKAKVNWAHIAIAGMMQAGFIARTLTFNFDNVLARACGLAGLYPPTYDFAVAPSETFQHFGDRAVLHLHGQGHGFEMFNSEEKTRLHALRLHPVLTDTFHNFPLMVIGYSGQSDAVFAEMERIFSGRQRLLWLSYGEDMPSHVESLLAKGGRTSQFFGGADADKFLVELARKLDCFPSLFEDPYGHLLGELEEIAPHPFPVDGRGDMLNGLRKNLTEARGQKLEKGPSIEDIYRQGDWDSVISRYNPSVQEEVDFAYWAAINKADAAFEQARSRGNAADYNAAFAIYDRASQISPNRAEALNNWAADITAYANMTSNPERMKEAIQLYERANLISPDDGSIQNNWGNALSDLAKMTGDEEYFKLSFEKYKRAIELFPDDSAAYNGLGSALADLAARKKDESLFTESFSAFEKAVSLDPEYHRAFNNWGSALGDLARINKDPVLFSQAFSKYKRATELKQDYHEAFHNWGSDLAAMARRTGDLENYDLAFEKYRSATDIKPEKYETYNNWAGALGNLASIRKDSKLFQDAFEKYKRATDINPQFDDAFMNWAVDLVSFAKIKKDEGLYEAAFEKFSRAIEIKSDKIAAFYGWGHALFELGVLKQSSALILAAIEKHSKACVIDPGYQYALQGWLDAVQALQKMEINADTLKEEIIKLDRAESDAQLPSPGLAAVMLSYGDPSGAKEKLLNCENRGTIYDVDALEKNFITLNSSKWFKELIARLRRQSRQYS